MCTDVDRNDKSRICLPGTVRVIGRRQIEMYSRLIHTVDHVEGFLRPEFDALDAFLCHTWEVTVTGAPKTWAIQFVEDTERSPRCWYGGAVGLVGFDGTLNTYPSVTLYLDLEFALDSRVWLNTSEVNWASWDILCTGNLLQSNLLMLVRSKIVSSQEYQTHWRWRGIILCTE